MQTIDYLIIATSLVGLAVIGLVLELRSAVLPAGLLWTGLLLYLLRDVRRAEAVSGSGAGITANS